MQTRSDFQRKNPRTSPQPRPCRRPAFPSPGDDRRVTAPSFLRLALVLALALTPLAGRLDAAVAAIQPPASGGTVGTVELFTVDGERIRGRSAGADGTSIRVETGSADGGRTLPIDQVLSIGYPSRLARVPTRNVEVALVDGDTVAGSIVSGDEFDLRLRTDFGNLTIELDRVRGVSFPALRELGADTTSLDPSDEVDRLLKVSGDRLDVVEGTLIAFESDRLIFSGPVGDFPFPYDEVAAVLLMQDPTARAGDRGEDGIVQVHRTDRSRLTGKLIEWGASSIRLESASLGEITLPIGGVATVSFFHSGVRYLSDLEPSEVVETPYFGDDSDFLFRYRRDRTVTGAPLRIDGIRFRKGLGVHSRSRMTWKLDGQATRFHALIGLSDEVLGLPAPARVVFRVLVDGEIAFESPVLAAGQPPRPIPAVDLGNAKRMTLEVDFGDGTDAGDRAVWAHPVLVR